MPPFREPAADACSAITVVAEQVSRSFAFSQQAFQKQFEEAAFVPLAGLGRHCEWKSTAISLEVSSSPNQRGSGQARPQSPLFRACRSASNTDVGAIDAPGIPVDPT